MATSILPIVKAVAPYIAQIASVAIPAFTSRKDSANNKGLESDPLISKQIEELQEAASQNTKSVKALAENLEKAMTDIERSVQTVSDRLAVYEKRLALYRIMVPVAIGLSVVSVISCLYIAAQ